MVPYPGTYSLQVVIVPVDFFGEFLAAGLGAGALVPAANAVLCRGGRLGFIRHCCCRCEVLPHGCDDLWAAGLRRGLCLRCCPFLWVRHCTACHSCLPLCLLPRCDTAFRHLRFNVAALVVLVCVRRCCWCPHSQELSIAGVRRRCPFFVCWQRVTRVPLRQFLRQARPLACGSPGTRQP